MNEASEKSINFQETRILWIMLPILFILALLLAFLSNNFAIALIFAGILIWISIKKIEIGIYFLALYIPFEPFLLKFAGDEIYPFLKYSQEVIILILAAIVLLKYHSKHKLKYIKTPIDIPLAIFIFITAVSAVLNLENFFIWILGLRQLLRYVVLYYIIVYSKIFKKIAKKIVVLILALLIIQSAIGIAQAFVGKSADKFLLPGEQRGFASIVSPDYVNQFWSSGQRVFSTMGRYDRLGTFICLAVILALGIFYEAKNKKIKTIMLAVICFSLPTFILTYSRMSWFGFLLALLFINIIIKKNKKFAAAFVFIIIFLFAYLFIHIKTNEMRLHSIVDKPQMTLAGRILSLASVSELKNSYYGKGRLYFIINTPMKVVRNYPFFGVGMGQYGSGTAYSLGNKDKYYELSLPFGIEGTQGQIDNNWFSIWGEAGTFGVLAFFMIILNLFIYSLKLYKKTDDKFIKGITLGFLGIIIAVSFQALLGPYFEARILSFNFWLLAGLAVSLGTLDTGRQLEI